MQDERRASSDALLAVDVRAQQVPLARDRHPRPPLAAHRRVARALLAESTDSAARVEVDVVDAVAALGDAASASGQAR